MLQRYKTIDLKKIIFQDKQKHIFNVFVFTEKQVI